MTYEEVVEIAKRKGGFLLSSYDQPVPSRLRTIHLNPDNSFTVIVTDSARGTCSYTIARQVYSFVLWEEAEWWRDR